MNKYGLLVIVGGLFGSGTAAAEIAEPVDKNNSGLYVGLGAHFAASLSSSSLTRALGGGGALQIGYTFARDTWNRSEVDVEFGGAFMSGERKKPFGDSDYATLIMPFYSLFRYGYGYSIGQNTFAVWRAGMGPVAFYDSDGPEAKDRRARAGLVAMVGLDIVAPVKDTLELFGGGHIRHVNLNQPKQNYNTTSFALNGGLRLKF